VGFGLDLVDHHRVGAITIFGLEKNKKLMNLVDQYYAMKGSVTPMKYGTYIRNLKSILHNALEEITYIQHIEPSIAELRQKISRRVEEMTLHIYIPQ